MSGPVADHPDDECRGCGVEIGDDASQAAADGHWNTRAHPAPEASAGGVTQADRDLEAWFLRRMTGDWSGHVAHLLARHRVAHAPGFHAARDRAVEALGQIASGAALGTQMFADCMAGKKSLTWHAVNVLQSNLSACEGTAKAALATCRQQQPGKSPLNDEGKA